MEELRIFCSYGDEEQNVAAAQLNKLALTACDHATVDKFLNDLDDGWGRAGSLVNDVTVLGLIEEQFGIDGEGQQAKRLGEERQQFVQVIELQRLAAMWDARGVIGALRMKTRQLRMRKDMREGLPGATPSPASRKSRQVAAVTEPSGGLLTSAFRPGCKIHGPDAKHTDAECRVQQAASRTTTSNEPKLDPALPRGTCNAYYLHGSCKRGANCKWKHDQTKAPPQSNVPSTQAVARQPAPMPDLLDLDAPAVPVPSRACVAGNAVEQLASLPPQQLTAVMQAFMTARDSTRGTARQCAVKRVRQEAEQQDDRPERGVVLAEPLAPNPEPEPNGHNPEPIQPDPVVSAAQGDADDELSARIEQLRIEAAADKDKPRCGSTKTASGKPCRNFVPKAGMRCAKHDDSKLKCNGKNKDGKPCSDNALDGMIKCKRHVKEFLGAGGDATLLRRMSDDASGGGVQAAIPATPSSSRDDRIICDSGATNYTAHLGGAVGRLTR